MSGRSIVHINGRAYDASRPLVHQTQSIDGVVSHAPRRPVRSPSTPKHHKRGTQKSSTLHRRAVQKPAVFQDIAQSTNSSAVSKPHVFIHAKHNVRVQHAKHVEKSPQVHKFSDVVAPSPPSGHHFHTTQDTHTATPMPAAPPLKTKSELFVERQLKLADAHHKQLHKKKNFREKLMQVNSRGRKSVRMSAAIVAGLLITGFVLYQNSTGLSLQLANQRAGFAASLPSYTPNGYNVDGPVAYSPGKVIISFGSTAGDRQYQIEQQPSQWTSDTLQEQVASANGGQYQTYQSKGMKIFFSGNNTATWVDDGVLYTLRGESGLASEQIASIASSM